MLVYFFTIGIPRRMRRFTDFFINIGPPLNPINSKIKEFPYFLFGLLLLHCLRPTEFSYIKLKRVGRMHFDMCAIKRNYKKFGHVIHGHSTYAGIKRETVIKESTIGA